MKPRFLRAANQEMPFLDHLEELRWRILWSLIALAIGAVIGFVLVVRFDVLGLLVAPIEPLLNGTQLKYLSPTDPFFLTLKLGVGVGVLLASPIVVQQIWAFVSPALLPHERRAIVPALYLGLVLFLGGVALAYFVVLPITLEFMMGFQAQSLEQNITVGHYLSFVVRVLLAFGLVFELPVVMLVLAAIGLVDSRMLASKRRYAVVASVILASVITPGDFVVLTIFMMIPLLLLYELSIGLAKLVERRRMERAEVTA
ncbi:MAG: twin-arginine translocase subunit TatC [bacterium]|jgi:sec-independent protein translocase protein TatC|nr:MAG: twin-arginine translocase subunit TatC [bacterium]